MRRTSLKFVVLVVALLTVQAMSGALMAKPVSGKVVSALDGEPLIGATIQVQGSQTGAVTDFDGNFTVNAAGCAFGTRDGDVIHELAFSSSMEVKFTINSLFPVPQY